MYLLCKIIYSIFLDSKDSQIDDAEGQIVDNKRSMGGGKVHFLRSLR